MLLTEEIANEKVVTVVDYHNLSAYLLHLCINFDKAACDYLCLTDIIFEYGSSKDCMDTANAYC